MVSAPASRNALLKASHAVLSYEEKDPLWWQTCATGTVVISLPPTVVLS